MTTKVIFEKANKYADQCIKNGEFWIFRSNTGTKGIHDFDKAEKMYESFPERLIGVYRCDKINKQELIEYITEDLIWDSKNRKL